jgi:hypothetical protein
MVELAALEKESNSIPRHSFEYPSKMQVKIWIESQAQ